MHSKILLLISALVLPMTSYAASDNNYETPASHKLDHLSKELGLTAEQKAKVDSIFKAQHEKFATIHRESHDKVTELLNPEQAAKWEEMRRQHQAQMPKPQ
jgi:Spy/CpxP family protein refolding chaperone